MFLNGCPGILLVKQNAKISNRMSGIWNPKTIASNHQTYFWNFTWPLYMFDHDTTSIKSIIIETHSRSGDKLVWNGIWRSMSRVKTTGLLASKFAPQKFSLLLWGYHFACSLSNKAWACIYILQDPSIVVAESCMPRLSSYCLTGHKVTYFVCRRYEYNEGGYCANNFPALC